MRIDSTNNNIFKNGININLSFAEFLIVRAALFDYSKSKKNKKENQELAKEIIQKTENGIER